MNTFEGFSNHETWSAWLSLTSNSRLYNSLLRIRTQKRPVIKLDLIKLYLESNVNMLLKKEDPEFNLKNINWNEIADSLEIERLSGEYNSEEDIPPETPYEVLCRVKISGNTLKLPDYELSKELYKETSNVLKKIGGRWNTKEQGFIFRESPKEAIDKYLLNREVENRKKDFQFFETPSDLASVMVDKAGIESWMDVLEPSAGTGRIADEIKNAGVMPDVCELWDANRDILFDKGYPVIAEDFLTLTEYDGEYDRIIMNPPFSKGQDIKHVKHAMRLLKADGVIISIMSPAIMSEKNKPFLDKIKMHGGTVEKIPKGVFKESGTNIETYLVTIPPLEMSMRMTSSPEMSM